MGCVGCCKTSRTFLGWLMRYACSVVFGWKRRVSVIVVVDDRVFFERIIRRVVFLMVFIPYMFEGTSHVSFDIFEEESARSSEDQ